MIERPIRIVTDSGSDLPPGVASRLNITVVPLVVLFGDVAVEEPNLTTERFWELVAEHQAIPGTSQPSLGAFHAVFQSLTDQGYDVICITITSRHSGTFATAQAAAASYGQRVTVVDSRAISMGAGHLAMVAAQMAQEGAPRRKILSRLHSLRLSCHIFIHLESLKHIRHGGRAAPLMPLVDQLTRAMSLRTSVTLVRGELKLMGVSRSTNKSLANLARQISSLGRLETLIVMHVRAPERAAELAKLLQGCIPAAQEGIPIGEAGPVLACHGGPGVVGVGGWTALPNVRG
ncbi:MAG: DegV family protein [Anaerolineae bacterium]|jgi:DegV family protein with EDD domain|nr:DegV family protein [Chloroflexota bacterium]